MASRSEVLKCVHEGKVEIIDDYFLNYAILEDDNLVISESSFYHYLDFPTKDIKFAVLTKLSDTTISYITHSGNNEIGIKVMELIAFCVSIVELGGTTKKLSRKAVILLMFLATTGLNQLIEEDHLKIRQSSEPSFEEIIAGLKRVPPKPKK